MKKTIGIIANEIEDSGEKLHHLEVSYLPSGYAKGIELAGGLPFLIPISHQITDVKQYVSMVDKLVLTGGQNVNPVYYQEKAIFPDNLMSHKRDAFEFAIIKEALKQKKPIFGVCRGMQLLNVYFGGSLYQDLSQRSPEPVRHMQAPISSTIPTHLITTKEDSLLRKIYGKETKVNSFHFQAVKRLAQGFEATAQSEDGIIEGIENQNKQIMGVQWHPDFAYTTLEQERRVFDFVVNKL